MDDEEEDLELNNPSTNGFQYDSNRSTSSIQRNFAVNDENTNSDNNANQNNHRSRMVVRIISSCANRYGSNVYLVARKPTDV